MWEWAHFIQRPETHSHVIFLDDYDMLSTGQLVQGVDVWINASRRPWEASGTSGMKVLVNGGINLSELDGWWAEAYTPEVGWALGDGREHGDDPARDVVEAGALYDLPEQEVIPEFYARDQNGIPTAWIARMRESMARLTPRFSADRTVRDYTEQHYLPAAAAFRERAANKGAVGRNIVQWPHTLREKWMTLRFEDVKVQTNAAHHIFEAEVYLNDLDPNAARGELYEDGVNGGDSVRQEMTRVRQMARASGGYAYSTVVPAARPPADYTPRVIPHCDGVAIPLEEARTLWQR
jgi:starch phosphorylase